MKRFESSSTPESPTMRVAFDLSQAPPQPARLRLRNLDSLAQPVLLRMVVHLSFFERGCLSGTNRSAEREIPDMSQVIAPWVFAKRHPEASFRDIFFPSLAQQRKTAINFFFDRRTMWKAKTSRHPKIGKEPSVLIIVKK